MSITTCCPVDTTDKSMHPANGRRVLDVLSAWLLRPEEVFESEAQDMGQQTVASNRYLLVVVDKASKFLFAFPLPTNQELGVAVALLDVVLTFGLMISLCSHPGTEVTAEVVGDLCQWLNLCIHYGPADPARVQGISERLEGWLEEALREL